MKGIDLYKKLSIRDYTNSEKDQYAQLLQTLFYHLKEELFPLLEEAHLKGKQLSVTNQKDKTIYIDNQSVKDVILK